MTIGEQSVSAIMPNFMAAVSRRIAGVSRADPPFGQAGEERASRRYSSRALLKNCLRVNSLEHRFVFKFLFCSSSPWVVLTEAKRLIVNSMEKTRCPRRAIQRRGSLHKLLLRRPFSIHAALSSEGSFVLFPREDCEVISPLEIAIAIIQLSRQAGTQSFDRASRYCSCESVSITWSRFSWFSQ